MGQLISSRRAALDGLSRILDAGAPEELFAGPPDDAAFLWMLLSDVARARSSSHYWEICHTARRRRVTPEYVVDRAAVLLATIEERRRADLYRTLGVPALAPGETIRQRWLEVAKQHHPDVGGDGAQFRRAKQAYETLRDPARRLEYERFWLRALGPFERVATRDDLPPVDATTALRLPARLSPRSLADSSSRSMTAPADDDAGAPPLAAILARAQALLAPAPEIEATREEVARAIGTLETIRDHLAALAAVKRALAV